MSKPESETKIGRLRIALGAAGQARAQRRASDVGPVPLLRAGAARHRLQDAATGARRADQDLADALLDIREDGSIPWDWIVDESRTLTNPLVASTVAGWMTTVLDQARLDPWDGEPPVVLCESLALVGVLARTADRYLVPIAPTRGQCAGFLRTDIAPILVPDQRVLYLGDWDVSGHQIEENTRSVLERAVGELAWERLAITERQIKARKTLSPIVKSDKRYRAGGEHEAYETEALGQSTVAHVLRNRLDRLLPEPIEDVLEREAAERNELAAYLRRRR